MVQRKLQRRAVDGVLLLDKPVGLSSNHALQQARRLLNAAKAGHTGTLDPMASGLLPLTFGEATKFSQLLLDADKCYCATAMLGVTTTTGDAEGEVLRERPLPASLEDLPSVLAGFVGEISQVPPMYSALKRDGRPLYQLARQGIEVERSARKVRIHSLELLGVDGCTIRFEVLCSKGTYVRTLAEDIGEALGCGAHLCGLRRTAIGPLDLAHAITPAVLEACDEAGRDRCLSPVDSLVGHLPSITLSAEGSEVILHGGALRGMAIPGQEVRLYGPQGFIGLGRRGEDGLLWPKRLLASAQAPRSKGID